MVQKRSRSQKRSRQQRKSRSRSQRRTRSQRGGVWYNPLSWFSSEPQYYFGQEEEGIVDKVGNTVKSGLEKADAAIADASTAAAEGAQKLVQSTTDVLNTDVPVLPSNEPKSTFPSILPTSNTMGGRSRSRSRALAKSRGRSSAKARSRHLAKKGGRGLGLTYYASPVDDAKVAQPTYLENYQGGKRRRTRTMKRSRK